MEGVVTRTPRGHTFVICICHCLRLTLYTRFHDVVPTDRTVIHSYVPRPESNSSPLLDLKLLLGNFLGVYFHLVHLCTTVSSLLAPILPQIRGQPTSNQPLDAVITSIDEVPEGPEKQEILWQRV